MKFRLAFAGFVAIAAIAIGGSAGSATSVGGPSSSNDVTPAVLWMTPGGSTTLHRGNTIPMNLDFKNSEPFPAIYLSYTDSSGQHYVVQLTFQDGTGSSPEGYYLTIPSTFPLTHLTAQSIEIDGISGKAGDVGAVGVHSRNQEYIGIAPTATFPMNQPFARKYNIDFTRLDLTIH